MIKINRLLKNFKLEIFFIYKLLNPKYTPVCAGSFGCYIKYFKNRFFYGSLFNKFPGLRFEGNDDFEIHILCQKSDIWMMTWCLYSFLYFSGLKPKAIIIHDDGSIDGDTVKMLESKFSNLKVILRKEADDIVLKKLADKGKIHEYRKSGHILNLKLIDSILLNQGSAKIMVMDSDILFFKKPQEVFDFINSKNEGRALLWGQNEKAYDMSIVNEDYLKKYRIKENGSEYIQGSLNIFNNGDINLDMMEEYYNNCNAELGFYFVEASAWVSLLGQLNFKLLSNSYKVKGLVDNETIAKHYTSGRRQELYAHGIGLVRGLIEDEKNKN